MFMHSVAYKISIMQIIIVLLDDITWEDGDGRTVFLDDLNPWDSIWSVMERIDEEVGIPTYRRPTFVLRWTRTRNPRNPGRIQHYGPVGDLPLSRLYLLRLAALWMTKLQHRLFVACLSLSIQIFNSYYDLLNTMEFSTEVLLILL